MKFILVYITHENMKEARRISSFLLKKRLIACVNYFPIQSSYWWKGKIEHSKEIVSLVKAKKENWTEIKKQVQKMHTYETPCIFKIEASASKEYFDWITREI